MVKNCAASTVASTMPAASAVVVPYSSQRRVLLLPALSAAASFLAWQPGAANGFGVTMPANGLPLVLNEKDHGPLVHGPVYGFSGAGPVAWSFTEVIGPEQGY